VISPSHRPLLDNTQQSQETDAHASGAFWTHNRRKRAATDRSATDRLAYLLNISNSIVVSSKQPGSDRGMKAFWIMVKGNTQVVGGGITKLPTI